MNHFTMNSWRAAAAVLSAAVLLFSNAQAAEPELVSVKKIWDEGKHNAFTDLIYWHGKWYCTFRESDGHVGGNGKLRVIESEDGEKWESSELISEEGVDLRDPKLSIMPDGRLMMTTGGSVYDGKTLLGRRPRVAFSADGRTWTAPERVLEEEEWLWRTTWYGGRGYGVAYNAFERKTAAAQQAAQTGKAEPGPADWKLQLVTTTNGTKFDLVTHLDVPGHPNETTLRFLPDGEMIAMVRREGGSTFGWIGRSRAPYTKWTWKETEHRFGGPNFIRLPDGQLWAVARSYPGGAKTVVARMTADGLYKPVLTLPSGGDNSYAGLAWHEGLLWLSYYSSHEGKTSIYLAKVKLPLEAENIGTRLEPLVDSHLLDRTIGGARLVAQLPKPREVVFTADAPWEGNTSAYFTLFPDGDKYRMYYRGSHMDEKTQKSTHPEVTCYAESSDGLHWTKPQLGLCEFDGSTQNNIIWNQPGSHCFTPFRDDNPNCTPEARYKAVTRVKGGLLPLKSADGIRWQPMTDKPVITDGAFDSQNLAYFDPHVGKYREYHRAFRGHRDIMTGLSDDFLTWTKPHWLDYPQAPVQHLYTNAIQSYPGAPHILLGFPTRFLPTTQQTEPIVMFSRDGTTFSRYDNPVIPRTAPKDRDGNRSNYMAWGLLQLSGETQEWSVFGTEAYREGRGGRLRRFTYRPDGLVALHAGSEGGGAVTRPLQFAGRGLLVNYATRAKGSVRVELQNATGETLAHFAAGDCRPLAGDSLAAEVTWPDDDLLKLAGESVRIRFVLQDADLFSFRFE